MEVKEYTKKGNLLINRKKKDLKMFSKNNKLYKMTSLFVIMLHFIMNSSVFIIRLL